MPADSLPTDAGPGRVLHDAQRLAAVDRLTGALDDASGIDRITRLAARLLTASHAQVSLVAQDQVVASLYGQELLPAQRRGPAADSLCTVVVERGAPLVVADARVEPLLAVLPPVARGDVRAYLGVPLVDSAGLVLGSLCVYDRVAREWSQEHRDVLTELADSVVAELELRALTLDAARGAARLGLALDAADIGSFDLNTQTGELLWDERLIRLFGYSPDAFVGHVDSFDARLHPEDLERQREAITKAIATHGDLATEYRIVRPGGEIRWIESRGRVLPGAVRGAAPRLLGVAYDNTDVRDARDRLVRVLETMNDAFFTLDDAWRFTYVNRQAERVLGRSRQEMLGQMIWEQFPEALDSPFQDAYESAVLNGRQAVFEAYFEPLKSWFQVSAWPGPDGLSVYFNEVSARKQAETERRRADEARERAVLEREQAVVERQRAYAEAGAANSRLALLADASTRLSESLEPRQVLERLTTLIVPRLGTWAVVALTAETWATQQGKDSATDLSRVHVVQVAHTDLEQGVELERALEARALSTADPVGVGAVVRTGLADWAPDTTAGAAGAAPPDGPDDLRPVGVLTLPLRSRGRVLGALSVALPSGSLDRTLLADLASRAAGALDNALLYGAERRTGITLQRSLLPRRVPAVDGLCTAARYLPGASGAFVGGDWFQGVRVGDDLLLAMGDVMGHGMRSAARMGQLRAIVATLALEGHGPHQLLSRLAQSVDVLLDLELATLLVAVYAPATATLTIASAGHPPPLLLPADGPARFVAVEPGPPLGSFSGTYEETVLPVAPGDLLVLYTDGLVENREESLDAGLERLRAALSDLRLPPEATCDQLLEAMGRRGGGSDDVALLVLARELGAGDRTAAEPGA